MLAFIEVFEAKIEVQFAFYPPIENNTFFPSDCHCEIRLHGGDGMVIVPSEFIVANATITRDALPFTSFVVPLCPG